MRVKKKKKREVNANIKGIKYTRSFLLFLVSRAMDASRYFGCLFNFFFLCPVQDLPFILVFPSVHRSCLSTPLPPTLLPSLFNHTHEPSIASAHCF